MVHFFGIFGPGPMARNSADEAPAKANFFGGRGDDGALEASLSRVEQDACYLSGKAPEPDPRELFDPLQDGLSDR